MSKISKLESQLNKVNAPTTVVDGYLQLLVRYPELVILLQTQLPLVKGTIKERLVSLYFKLLYRVSRLLFLKRRPNRHKEIEIRIGRYYEKKFAAQHNLLKESAIRYLKNKQFIVEVDLPEDNYNLSSTLIH